MSTTSTALPAGPRPRPVLLYGMINTAVLAFLGGAGAVGLIPAVVVAVVALAWAVVGGAWAFYVQSVTTPTADPRDDRGVPLMPRDVAKEAEVRAAETGVVSPTPPSTDGPILPRG